MLVVDTKAKGREILDRSIRCKGAFGFGGWVGGNAMSVGVSVRLTRFVTARASDMADSLAFVVKEVGKRGGTDGFEGPKMV